MRILIIGGTGLISTAITRLLVERGHDVTLYNRGRREARFPAGPKTIVGDRRDFPVFESQMREAGTFDMATPCGRGAMSMTLRELSPTRPAQNAPLAGATM